MPLQELLNMLPEGPMPILPLLEALSAAVIMADSDGNVVFWNKGAEGLFQYSSEEMMGKSLVYIMPEKFRQAHSTAIANRKNAPEGAHSSVIGKTNALSGLKKDGSEFPMQLSVVRYNDGNKTCYLGVIKDVTEVVMTTQEIIAKQLLQFAEGVKERMVKIEDKLEHAAPPVALGISCPFAGSSESTNPSL